MVCLVGLRSSSKKSSFAAVTADWVMGIGKTGFRESGRNEPITYSRQPTVREKQGGKSGGEYSSSPLILSLGGERKIKERVITGCKARLPRCARNDRGKPRGDGAGKKVFLMTSSFSMTLFEFILHRR
jgi:hypothetical protein